MHVRFEIARTLEISHCKIEFLHLGCRVSQHEERQVGIWREFRSLLEQRQRRGRTGLLVPTLAFVDQVVCARRQRSVLRDRSGGVLYCRGLVGLARSGVGSQSARQAPKQTTALALV